MSDSDDGPALGAAAAAAADEPGGGPTLSNNPYATLVSILGHEWGGDPGSEFPQKHKDVTGATPMAELSDTAVDFILLLSELEDVHKPSFERAQATPSVAKYMARWLYNDAFSDVPASDHPRMQGPKDLSKKPQIKAYKGLTPDSEPEAYNLLCNVGPALLRAAATARFTTANAAPVISPGSDAFDPAVLAAVAETVGAALGPTMTKMSELAAAGQTHLATALQPLADQIRERKVANEAAASNRPPIGGRGPAGGGPSTSKHLTSTVLDNAFKRPEVQAALDQGIEDLVKLQDGTHALCDAGHRYGEDEALGLVFQQVQKTGALHYVLMHHVTPNLVSSKGPNQPRADLLRSLYSRLVSHVAVFAQDQIENYRHTRFAVKAGGITEIMEHAQHVNPSFFGTSLGDQLIGADYHGTPLKVIGWDSLEKWLDLVFELLQLAHPAVMTDNLIHAARNCLRTIKGAGWNTPGCFKSLFHEKNLSNFGRAVTAWKSDVRTILADGNAQLTIRDFPDVMMYYDQANMSRTFQNADEADAQVQRALYTRLRTERVKPERGPRTPQPDLPDAAGDDGEQAGGAGADDMADCFPEIPRDAAPVFFPGYSNEHSLQINQMIVKKHMCERDAAAICPAFVAGLVDPPPRPGKSSLVSPHPGCTAANCQGQHILPRKEPAVKLSKKFIAAARKIIGPYLTSYHSLNDPAPEPKRPRSDRYTDQRGQRGRSRDRSPRRERPYHERSFRDRSEDRREPRRARSREPSSDGWGGGGRGRGSPRQNDGWGAPRPSDRHSRDRSKERSPSRRRDSDNPEPKGIKRDRSQDRERSPSRDRSSGSASSLRRPKPERSSSSGRR